MTYPPIDFDQHPELIAAGRELDRVLWPVIDRILARLGLTREELRADPSCVERAARRAREAGGAGEAGQGGEGRAA
jgi:hypothetical protein